MTKYRVIETSLDKWVLQQKIFGIWWTIKGDGFCSWTKYELKDWALKLEADKECEKAHKKGTIFWQSQ
ncbi:MAG: hypothetical protein RIS47_700 [Bacteroidota bacterium]|jgi:hypothetical protein